MTEVQERRKKTVEASMTEQVHLIMQQHLNGGGRLFGGALMQWLDEVAGVVAMRHAETYRVVTAAVDNLQFKHAIYEGEIVVLKGYVTYVGRTSMEVEIDTYVEQPDGMRHTVNRAFFVMDVVSGGAADNAGIQKSDIITKLDGQKVSSKADINDKLQYYTAGEEIEVGVARLSDGEYVESTITVTLGARPDSNQ